MGGVALAGVQDFLKLRFRYVALLAAKDLV